MSRRYFRVAIPTNADKLLSLANNILQKHQQDGKQSILAPVLIKQLEEKVNIAREANAQLQKLNRDKEKLNEERELILGVYKSYDASTVRYIITAARDILLGLYRGNERMLGDWGYTVNSPKGKPQIIIPRNADNLIALAKSVMQKHRADGKNSPLGSLDWDTLQQKLAEAEAKLEAARKANRDKEKATQTRNIALGVDKGQTSKTPNTVKYIVRSIRDVLLGAFRGKEQTLGDWGFEVNMSEG